MKKRIFKQGMALMLAAALALPANVVPAEILDQQTETELPHIVLNQETPDEKVTDSDAKEKEEQTGTQTETKTKKEPPKGGKKESSSGELFPPSKPEKPKRVAKEFIAPTLDEVIQHFIKQNAPERLDDWQEQAEIFFNHFDSIGWKNANGVKIERWDSKANLWILDRIRENRKNELDHDGRGKESIKQASKFDGEGSRQAQADAPTDRESDAKAQRKYSERF